MSGVDLNINNYDTYIRVREQFREAAGSSTYNATDLLNLANQAWGVNRSDDPTIPNKMQSLAVQVYQAIPDDDTVKRSIEASDSSQNYKPKLDQYLAATAEYSRSTGYKARSGINVEKLSKLTRWGIFAYGSLNNISGNRTNILDEVNRAGFASVYMTDNIKPEDIKEYNYEALLSKAESLLGEPNTDLEKVVKLLVFAIKGTTGYPRGSTAVGLAEVREVFDPNAINTMMLVQYPGFNDDPNHKARGMIEQAIKLLITAGDNTRLSWTSGLTVTAASALRNRDNNPLLNIDDIHSSAVNIPANTGNWQTGAQTDFNAAQARNVWQKYNRARDLLDSLPSELLPDASASTYRTEITAKKNAVLQGFTTEANKHTNTNKSQEYDWLEAGRTFVASLSSSDRSYTLPAGYTVQNFEQKLEALRRGVIAYHNPVGLNYLSNLNTLTSTSEIDKSLAQLNTLKNSIYKDLFDRYYAGELPGQAAANLKSALTAAERTLNITGVPPNATVSQRWETILNTKKTTLAATEAEERRLAEAALTSLRDAQAKLNEAKTIYETDVGLPSMAASTERAATASDTAINNFSNSNVSAALDTAVAAAGATGVNTQTIQNYRNLDSSKKIEEIAKKVLEDANRRKGETDTAATEAGQASSQRQVAIDARDAANRARDNLTELNTQRGLATTAANEAEKAARAAEEAALKARSNASPSDPPTKANISAQAARQAANDARDAKAAIETLINDAKEQQEQQQKIEAERAQAKADEEKNIAALLAARNNLSNALNIYNRLRLSDLPADTEARQRLRSLPKETEEARDAANAAANRNSYAEEFSTNLATALRETEEAARAADIQIPNNYSGKSPIEKVIYNAEKLFEDANARERAQNEAGRQKNLAATALLQAQETLRDSTKDIDAQRDAVKTAADNAKKAAEEAQKQAASAGTLKAAEDAAAAQRASDNTAGLLTAIDDKIKERDERQEIITNMGKTLEEAQNLYNGTIPVRTGRRRAAALAAIKPAIDSQDPAEIVDAIAATSAAWEDSKTQADLQGVLNATNLSDLKKVSDLLDIIVNDAKDTQKPNDASSGRNSGVLGVQ
ncbi:MAG: hypothetical protein LBK68_06420 [Candidatus Margulisbacteria bacterium]|jgi:hypothetical protein|nr:hypothetical protein [Candidatus Margulisiibacteriota bacterium]